MYINMHVFVYTYTHTRFKDLYRPLKVKDPNCCTCVCARQVILQSCPTLCNPMNYSLPGSSVHGIFSRILEWVAMPSSRESFQPRDQIYISCISYIGRQILYHWDIWEALSCMIPTINPLRVREKKKSIIKARTGRDGFMARWLWKPTLK